MSLVLKIFCKSLPLLSDCSLEGWTLFYPLFLFLKFIRLDFTILFGVELHFKFRQKKFPLVIHLGIVANICFFVSFYQFRPRDLR